MKVSKNTKLDQKKKLAAISTVEIDLGHLVRQDIWQTLGESSPEVGKPGHGQSQPTSAQRPVSTKKFSLGVCKPRQGLTGHRHSPMVGAAGRREAAELSGRTALKQPLFYFICGHSLDSCPVPL